MPFCAQGCTYCNFASGVFPRDWEPRYLDALLAEIRAHSWRWQPRTVYLGGGTPSTLPASALRALLAAIPLGRPWRRSHHRSRARAASHRKWRSAGRCLDINRVSLGVQSFVEPEIRLYRPQTYRRSRRARPPPRWPPGESPTSISTSSPVSPDKPPASWQESLDWIERLAPPARLRLYAGGRRGWPPRPGDAAGRRARYGASDIPGDDAIADFYETAVLRLAAMGIPRYEISTFARPGFLSRATIWK